MSDLKSMIARTAKSGQLCWIGVRDTRRATLQTVTEAEVDHNGIVGDHARSGKRAVTLIQQEHLAVIGSYLGRAPVAAEDLRRNLVVSGINLASLKGRNLSIGRVVLHITGICAPCSRMEEAFGYGGYAAVRGHGGWCARVETPGQVRVGDRVEALELIGTV